MPAGGPTDLAICGPGGRVQTQIDLGPPFRTIKRCVYGEQAASIPGPRVKARGGGWRKATRSESALMRRSQRRRTPQSNELARMNQTRLVQQTTQQSPASLPTGYEVAVTGFSPVRHRVGGVKVQTIYGHNLSLITSVRVNATPLPISSISSNGRSMVVHVPTSAGIQVSDSQQLILYGNPPWAKEGYVWVFGPENIGPVTFPTFGYSAGRRYHPRDLGRHRAFRVSTQRFYRR